jgi:hypothetical protein
MAVTFLEHFIQWREPLETLQFGGALALAVAALMLFQLSATAPRKLRRRTSPTLRSARSATKSSRPRRTPSRTRRRGGWGASRMSTH